MGPRGSRVTSGCPKPGSRGTSRVSKGQGDVRAGLGVEGYFKGVPWRLDRSSDDLLG